MSDSGSAFEATGLSGLKNLPPDTVFECGVCWRHYDPREGDDYWQIPPNTAFADLPEDWSCPNCDTPREKFVPLSRDGEDVQVRISQLLDDYREAGRSLQGTDMYNAAMSIESVGFRPHDQGWIGIMITPWFMNVMLLPRDRSGWEGHETGKEESVVLPSGEFVFVHGELPKVGQIKTCSLFSPMDDFARHSVARETAMAALAALFNPNIDRMSAEPEPKPKETGRRTLLFGRKRPGEQDA